LSTTNYKIAMDKYDNSQMDDLWTVIIMLKNEKQYATNIMKM
jgi:hypothetical protein